jgi:ABC-type multidrug transport system fused ATPase/permease subunit
LTIIVIAHRLSTIQDADKIIVLSKGKLIEQGTHDQILKELPNGTYAGFVSKQKTAEDKGDYSATPAKEV